MAELRGLGLQIALVLNGSACYEWDALFYVGPSVYWY